VETRRFHALHREETVDGFAVHTKDTADAHRIEPPVVDQPPNRLGMHAELIRNLANADEPGFFA
jgi:hypothetical protein